MNLFKSLRFIHPFLLISVLMFGCGQSTAESLNATEKPVSPTAEKTLPSAPLAEVESPSVQHIEEVQETLKQLPKLMTPKARREYKYPPKPLPEILDEHMIDDFEGDPDDMANTMGGASGDWNLNPADINDSYADPYIMEMEGIDGKPTQVMSLTYSVDTQLAEAVNGYWTELNRIDASGYDHLLMDIKGDAKAGFTELFKIEIKKPKPEMEHEHVGEDEVIKGTYIIPVTDEWVTVQVPLNRMTGLINFLDPKAWEDPSIGRMDLDQLVLIFHSRMVTKKTGKIYLDNIRFVKTGNPGPTAVDKPQHDRQKTETKLEGLDFAAYLVSRLGGFPEKTLVKKEFPEGRDEFFKEVAKDTWRFFDEIVDTEHGLPLDTIQVAPEGDEAFAEGMWVGDYTNVTNIGVYLMALVSGFDLGFISKEDVLKKIETTLHTLEHKLKYHESGFPYNYYDTTLAISTEYFVSLVDSGWYLAGLYVIKNAFPDEVGERAQKLIDRGNIGFFYDDVDRQFFHGFYEHLDVYSDYHYGVFYSEPRATSYIGIARGEVPVEHWYGGLIRTFNSEYSWQKQKPINQIEKEALGHKYVAGHYRWKDLDYVPSWGGSAFEALMPTLVLEEKELAPEGIGLNNERHVQGQIRFALEQEKYDIWGMSPSSVPEGGYSEFGAAPFGSKGYKSGAITPHASALAVEYAPEAVEKNLRTLIEKYDVYGEYGFYDAVNPETGVVARKYLALDQGMILVALNNYLNDGAIRKRFHSDPVLKTAEKLLTSEKMFEDTND